MIGKLPLTSIEETTDTYHYVLGWFMVAFNLLLFVLGLHCNAAGSIGSDYCSTEKKISSSGGDSGGMAEGWTTAPEPVNSSNRLAAV